MSVTNIRTQHPVGQGYFQTGELREGETLRLRYVYDCGAMTKYAEARDAQIDGYLAAVAAGQPLDILFISHAHADHLNGVERLLDKTKGLAVKTIVMPLLNVEDRLVAYARASSEDPPSAQNSFYQAFVTDPVSALSRFNPERIIFVKPGNRADGAPFRGGPEDSGGGGPDFAKMLDGEQLSWKIVGRGTIEHAVRSSDKSNNGTAFVMSDTLALTTKNASPTYSWLLAPFVDPTVKAGTALFIAALANATGLKVGTLKGRLRRSTYVEKLLTDHVSELRTAYAAISTDLNVTSMCLYSGPIPASNAIGSSYQGKFGLWNIFHPQKLGVAWLGTGDAAFAHKKRRAAFFKHYGSLFHEVVTLTLPHHGSDHNFHPTLLKQIEPMFCVAAADQFSNWRHPGTAVTQAVSSTGRFMSVVTADIVSKVWEMVNIY